MKLLLSCLVALFSFSVFSQDFQNINVSTKTFTLKESKGWQTRGTPSHCRVQIKLDENNNVLKLKMGVVGSVFDAFGWNMEIPLTDLPLSANYEQVFDVPGNTTMILTYDGTTLTFKRDKNDQIWNRLYPFSLTIDSNLQNPKAFKGTIEGYERTVFGLKKHVKQECQF